MTKVVSPIEGFTGQATFGSTVLDFKDGTADAKDAPEGVVAYLRSNGFTVDGNTVDAPEPAKVIDSRDIVEEQVGSKARDAAVDPQPEDFLPPVNAGKADPHGPKVVAPQIHATPEQPVRPGPVSDAADVQSADESEHAADNLVSDSKPRARRAATKPAAK